METRQKFIASLTKDEQKRLEFCWAIHARPKQLPPSWSWSTWLLSAGRGFGKTRCGAEWIRNQVESGKAKRIALVGRTAADVRDVIVGGESGILAVSPPWFKPDYVPSKRRLIWPNGAIATTYTADEPDQLRGPQHDAAWADELAAWRYPDAWDQLMFGLRLGKDPRAVVTTTPRPTPIIRDLIAQKDTHLTTGSTYENKANLAERFIQKIVAKFEGTRLGRQELYAEMLDDAPGALWKRDQIELLRFLSTHDKPRKLPDMKRVIVAVDPSVSADAENAATGIVVIGLGSDLHGYLLEDASMVQPTPDQWAREVDRVYRKHNADLVVAEVNQGGDLVESNVRTVNPRIHYRSVRATRGKYIRAEPIAGLTEQGKIHHVGHFAELEDELCQWEPNQGMKSPNRLDAYVWGFTEVIDEMTAPPPATRVGHVLLASSFDDRGIGMG